MTDSQNINLKTLPTLLPRSINWQDFFGNNNPVDLEIGCGRPHFFYDRLTNHPDRNIVGIEWKYEFIAQAQRRIVRENIKNAAAFHGNAWLLVPLLFSPLSIAQVFINFPDPWWKMRHKKRLILNDTFLDILHTRLKDDGTILLQTDVPDLFLFYKDLFHQHGAFCLDESFSGEQIISQTKAQTHREKKCLNKAENIYRGVFTKVAAWGR